MPTTRSRSVSILIQASTAPILNQFWLHSAEEVERFVECFACPLDGGIGKLLFGEVREDSEEYVRGNEKLAHTRFLGLDYLCVFVHQLHRKVAQRPSKLSIHTVLKIGYFIRLPAGVSQQRTM